MERRTDVLRPLTSLRYFAALLVVLFHYAFFFQPGGKHTGLNIGLRLVEKGAIGVDFFFLLSGFILAYGYAKGDALRGTRRQFWVARVARIYPVYLLGLALALVPFLEDSHSRAGLVAALGAQPLLLQAWIPQLLTMHAWNTPSWSLSNEAFFYVLFPFVLIPLLGLSRRGLLTVALASWTGYLVVPFAIHAAAVHAHRYAWWLDTALRFNPIIHLSEFLIGAGVGIIFLRGSDRMLTWSPLRFDIAAVALVAAVAALLLVGGPRLQDYTLWALADVPLVLLIYVLAHQRGAISRLLAVSPLLVLGEASYSVYILHWPAWDWTVRESRALGYGTPAGPGFGVFFVALVTVTAVICFYAFERPARRAIRARFSEPRTPASLPESRARDEDPLMKDVVALPSLLPPAPGSGVLSSD